MSTAVVKTSSFKHPVQPMPNDAPSGTLRVIIWDEFSQRGASGTWYTGPHGDSEWWPRDVPGQGMRILQARWEYAGYNLTEFSIGYNCWQTNPEDREFRDILRQLDDLARRRGWKSDRTQAMPSEDKAQAAKDRADERHG